MSSGPNEVMFRPFITITQGEDGSWTLTDVDWSDTATNVVHGRTGEWREADATTLSPFEQAVLDSGSNWLDTLTSQLTEAMIETATTAGP